MNEIKGMGGAFQGSLAAAMGTGTVSPVRRPSRWALVWLFVVDVLWMLGVALLLFVASVLVVAMFLLLIVAMTYAARLGWNLDG